MLYFLHIKRNKEVYGFLQMEHNTSTCICLHITSIV